MESGEAGREKNTDGKKEMEKWDEERKQAIVQRRLAAQEYQSSSQRHSSPLIPV